MSGHTKGPWAVWMDFNVVAMDPLRRLVANAGGATNNKDQERYHRENLANARLIAAAPDLLEALKELALAADTAELLLREEYPARAQSLHQKVATAIAAVAKAEGSPE